MAENTTFLFVPGAWHSPDCFDPVVQRLEAANYNTAKVRLPSNGHGRPQGTFDDDVIEIRTSLEKIIDAGQRVIVFVHSYGSLPACDAIKGLDEKSCRTGGLPGGVVHIFFCAAFVIPEGKSLISTFGGRDLPWYRVSDDKVEVNVLCPEKVFYDDCDADQTEKAMSQLLSHSYQTFHSTCTYAAWKDVPSTYLYCLKDLAIPMAVQKLMVEETAKGCAFRTEVVDASHSPFISKPDETALAIRRAAGEHV